jgi:LysR family positive regulator for ilvC
MDQRSLELFLHLAESLSFSRTAEQKHLSLSAVSRSVQRMEAELGQRLFERDRRSVRLTPAGQRFQQYAREAVTEWQRVTGELRQDPAALRGEISVYCSVTASYSVLAPILENFRGGQPGIDIMLHTGDQADAVGRIHQGLEDVAVAARPDSLPGGLDFLTLMHSPLVFIAPGFDCSVREQLDGRSNGEWEGIPFILAERGVSKQRVDHWFREGGGRPLIYAQVAGHEAIAAMVALGLGIGVVPQLVLDNFTYRDRLSVLPQARPLGPFEVGLCANRQRLENPLVSAFWDSARRSYPDMK